MDVVRYLSQKGCGRILGLLPTAPLTDSRLVGPPHPLPTRVSFKMKPIKNIRWTLPQALKFNIFYELARNSLCK